MILTCTSCGTRYSVDGSKFPAAGRTVRCAKCGTSWHQAGETAEGEPAPAAIPNVGANAGAKAGTNASVSAGLGAPVADAAPSSLRSRPPAPPAEPRAPLGPKIAVVAGWLGLFAVVLLIVGAAVRYRQDIASIWPQSAGVYSSLGLHVNTSGIDFRQVDYRRETEDSQIVLAVTGVIVNTGSRQLPVPQTVRITLSDASNHEIYHWTFKPNATVLAAGQSIPFMTRLASPPAAARHLEVRFAKDGS